MAASKGTKGKPELLSEVESAIRLRMPPELLRYFSERSVKSGEDRKLQFVEKDGVRWYDPDELDEYDAYLRKPWPKSKNAQRPHLPSRIKEAIKLEAACACPVCGHDSSGEAAHIKPVSKTLSHHPSNLIWLCPNHHTIVDTVKVAHNVKPETVEALKDALVARMLRILNLERAASNGVLQFLRQVEEVSRLLASADFEDAKAGLQAIAKHDIAELKKQAEKAQKSAKVKQAAAVKPLTALAKSVSASIAKVDANEPSSVASFVQKAAKHRTAYLLATGEVDCPLCEGAGVRHGTDCPACGGDGTLDAKAAKEIDLRDYEDVNCPLCNGSGRHNGDECPVCHGERQIERRFAERVDLDLYQDVDCPVCDGSGRLRGERCPACDGDRKMERRFAERIDVGNYGLVDCPLCEEVGKSSDCPVCDGDHRMEARHAEQVDLSDYRDVDCRLCKGSGRVHGDDCRACGGNGQMERRFFDQIDWSDWETVRCPVCKGTGHSREGDCRACGGEGRMYRGDASRIE